MKRYALPATMLFAFFLGAVLHEAWNALNRCGDADYWATVGRLPVNCTITSDWMNRFLIAERELATPGSAWRR